jgi:hypothetical protein
MAWYAYCITEQQAFQGESRARRPFVINEIHGIGERQVMAYPSGELAVIVSEYKRSGDLDQKAILEHVKVVAECFRSATTSNTTVLPFRFGTIFDSDDALRRAVRANRKAFLKGVAHLRGKAEMHLKLLVKDGNMREALEEIVLPATVGGDYLTKLREKASRQRERQTKARAISVQVHKLFNPLEEEVSCKKVDSGGMLIDIAHLVDHKQIEKYQARYNSAARQFKDCELSVSGPWPPYHFLPGKLRTVTN